jgi:hypothetical protein
LRAYAWFDTARIRALSAKSNSLRQVTLNEGITSCDVSFNQIGELALPASLETIVASHNLMSEFVVAPESKLTNCSFSFNKLVRFAVQNEPMLSLDVSHNQLPLLPPIAGRLRFFFANDNQISR